MERKNIIILKKGSSYECWGSLKEICEVHNFPYWTLAREKYPFEYENFKFIKVPFRQKNEN